MNITKIEWIARWWVVVAASIIAAMAFVQATTEGEVTYQAALVAMCVAVVTFVQAVGMRSLMLSIGAFGGIASSYLWIAQDVEVSPANPFLFGLLVALLVVALFGSAWIWLVLGDSKAPKD